MTATAARVALGRAVGLDDSIAAMNLVDVGTGHDFDLEVEIQGTCKRMNLWSCDARL